MPRQTRSIFNRCTKGLARGIRKFGFDQNLGNKHGTNTMTNDAFSDTGTPTFE